MFGLLYLCSHYAAGKLSCYLLGLVSHDSKFERLRRDTVTELPAKGSGVSRSKTTLIPV